MSTHLESLVNQLRSTLGRMEMALGAIADAIVWIGQDGKIQWCNAAFDQLVKQPHILVLGKTFSDLLPLSQAGQAVPLTHYPDARVLGGEYPITEYEFQQGDRPLVLEIAGNCLERSEGDSEQGLPSNSAVLVIRDVTQAKQAQADCQQAEQQRQQFFALMRATLESMDDAVLVLTTDRQSPIYNQKFLAMWSMPEALMQPGREDERIQWLLEQTKDPKAFLARIWELFRDRPAETALELIEMKDGRMIERLAQPLWHNDQILGRVWTYRDVTQSVQTEQALREREAKFRSLVENANDLIFAIDATGVISYISPNVETMMGFTAMAMEGDSFMPFIHPDDLQRCLDALQHVTVSGQGLSNLEYRARHQDGSWHWYIASLAAPQAVSDQHLIVGIARDITKAKRDEIIRQQTEAALRQSELRFQAIFENAAVGTTLAAQDGTVLQVNPAWLQALGYSEAEFRQMKFADYTHPDDVAADVVLTQAVFAGARDSFQLEKRYIRKDASLFWGRLTVSPIRNAEGTVQFTLALMEDINERKQAERDRQRAEAALSESETKFRRIVENTNDIISLIDLEGQIVYISPNLTNLTGYATIELEGALFMPFIHPDDQAACLNAFQSILTTDQRQCEVEYRAKIKDGRWQWQSTSLSTLEDVRGNLLVLSVARDVTDRKQAEEALRRSELKYRNIFENSQVGIGRTRLQDGLFLDVNQRYADIMGFDSTADLIGKRFTTEFYANPHDQQKILAELEQHGEVRNFEEELRCPDGSTAWGLLSLRLNADEDCLDFVLVDISDRKRLEEELRQSQQFLDNIIDNIPLAVFAKDVNDDFRYVLINKGSAGILGFTKEVALGLNDYELTPQAQADFYRAEDLATLAQGTLLECGEQWKQVQADSDETIAIRYWKLPLFDPQGNATHLLCLSEDITDRKQAEAAIARRARMDSLFSSISRQFVDQEADTAIHFTLQAIAQFIGVERCCLFEYSEPQRRLHTLYEWCHADMQPLTDSARSLALEQFPWYHAHILNGKLVQIAQVAALPPEATAEQAMFQSQHIQSVLDVPLVYADKVVGVLGVDVVSCSKTWSQEEINFLQLVSELIAIGRARHQAEEKFTKAFRASPSPIALTTLPERRFLDVNTSFLKMSGCSLEEIIGYTAPELDLGVPQETYSTAIQQLLETGSLYNQEVEFRTKSGEARIVLLSIELIDLSGTQCVLNIINDITERKQLENEFISLVSHELRTPLTSLMGGLYLLGSGQLGTLTPKGQNVLNIATTNTERLTRLVNDILDLERMKAGKMSVQPVACNAADLLLQAADAMQAMAEQAQITLVTAPLTATLFVDPDRILQTLTNLLSNAIKFSPGGSTVWLSAQLHADHIQIQVQDQGRGIPPDKLQLVFDRFQQVDQSDARQKGGTGLGLAICRNITEQHGGKIWVESVFGQGSTFFMTLPLVP
ncbi:PAS domain S-box protein [Stenomitos frigidus]|uniref:histidine kinase n=1 Tax=Stenomitos frigidus ULC18 TaxID=2107698 RepID=A0A2T1EBC3_9CYAN|nr:PAS domain S-box protein [Stenomitos frigidus]PSB30030.1 hypothetical protein C7B82_09665 [Stenomitos frigidus ULC18]